MPRVLIIIPFWHGAAFLPACLRSIVASVHQDRYKITIAVIDNGGELPPLEIFRDLDIRVVSTRNDIGFGRAVNAGLYLAQKEGFDFIVILNQDLVLETACLSELLHHADIGQSMCFPLAMDYEMHQVPEWYSNKYYGSSDVQSFSKIKTLEIASATCFAATAEQFSIGGYFDPAFPMYYEDDDYFTRYRNRGGQLLLVTSAVAGHYWGSTEEAQGRSGLRKRCGALRFSVRHRPALHTLKLLVRHYGSCLKHADFRRMAAYFKHDLQMVGSLHTLLRADHEDIQERAMHCLAMDLPESLGTGARLS